VINIKKLIPWTILLLISISLVSAVPKLLITDLDVTVDSKSDKNLNDGDKIRHEASPESDVSFKIELKNNFTKSEDLKIEDITVTIFIRDIDDEDDMEEESKEFYINPDKDKSTTLDFSLPLKIDEGTYSIDIEVNGEDENRTTHELTWSIYLEVEKEKHLLKLVKAELEDSNLKCSGSTYLNINLVNIGTSEEEDIELQLQNSNLNINERRDFTLTEDPFDSDSIFKEDIPIFIPKNTITGSYPLSLKITYDADRVMAKVLPLDVTCGKEPPKQQQPTQSTKPSTSSPITTSAVIQPTIIQSSNGSLIERYKYTVMVVLAYAFVLSALILAGFKVLKRKKT
jgi:uncharacterized membrane protein